MSDERESPRLLHSASAAVAVSVLTFLSGSTFLYLYSHMLPTVLYAQAVCGLCCFGSFFLFDGLAAVFVRTAAISILFSTHYFVPYPMDYFIIIVSLFHLGEFVATAISNPASLKYDSFLLNHSSAYHAAMLAACAEFVIEHYLFGEGLFSRRVHLIGLAGAVLGDVIRKVSMLWCGVGFSHLITFSRKKNHKLVRSGPYAFCRHPSYFGWALWSTSTQVCLCNPICTIVFALSSYKFFEDRIPLEEYTLKQLFGQEYDEYRAQVPFSGIPFVDGRF